MIPLPSKHSSSHQNRHPKCFSFKVVVKDVFLQYGANVMRSHCSRYFLLYLKALALSHDGDRAPETLHKINLNWYSKTRTESTTT